MNMVFLRGRLSSPAQQRVLRSGAVVVSYEVAVVNDDGPNDNVPVVWRDPPSPDRAARYDVGDEIVVVGCVRRRFFRAGGSIQSRTEVVAELLVPARQAKRAATVLSRRVEEVVGT